MTEINHPTPTSTIFDLLSGVFTQQSPGLLELTPEFRNIIMNPENWTVTTEWLEAYPMFAGMIGKFEDASRNSAGEVGRGRPVEQSKGKGKGNQKEKEDMVDGA